jgi:23S rRNA pseudouridine2605 synthase
MTEAELNQQRRAKWHVDGRPLETLDAARDWLASVGFCLMYPVRGVLAPTFIGAYLGSESKLPTGRTAFNDPNAQPATELMVRLLREKSAFEVSIFPDAGLVVAAAIFPYFYTLVLRAEHQPGRGAKLAPLAEDIMRVLEKGGAASKPQLQERLKGDVSTLAIERTLQELWSRLRITRVDYAPRDGAVWDTLERWAPEQVKAGKQLSSGEALSAAVSQYLEAVVAAEMGEIEAFFSPLVARSRVSETVNALLSAREFSFVGMGARSLVHMTPARVPVEPRVRPPRPEKPRAKRSLRELRKMK